MSHSTQPRDPGLLLSALIDESRQLREDVADRERRQRAETLERERRQRRLIALIGVGILIAIVLCTCVVILLVQSRQRGNDTRALLRANASVNTQIADCTTRGGTCYEEGARRSAALIRQLLQAQKEMELCQAKTEQDGPAALQRCIDQVLAPLMPPVTVNPGTPKPTPDPTPDPSATP
jgi:hypothetical protein